MRIVHFEKGWRPAEIAADEGLRAWHGLTQRGQRISRHSCPKLIAQGADLFALSARKPRTIAGNRPETLSGCCRRCPYRQKFWRLVLKLR